MVGRNLGDLRPPLVIAIILAQEFVVAKVAAVFALDEAVGGGISRQHRAGIHRWPLQPAHVVERTGNQPQDGKRRHKENCNCNHHFEQREGAAAGMGMIQLHWFTAEMTGTPVAYSRVNFSLCEPPWALSIITASSL